MELDEVLARARKDVSSGASEALARIIGDLITVITAGSPGLDTTAIKKFAFELFEARSSMAPIFHLANLLLLFTEAPHHDMERLKCELVALDKKEREATKRIAGAFCHKIEGERFLLISCSGTVIEALSSLASMRKITACVMESLPGGEGWRTARVLRDHGIETRVISDSMVFVEAENCDAGLSGADSMGEGGVVNKVGTHSLASACREYGIPCHILAGESKVLPFEAGDMMRTIEKKDGIATLTQVFERVPLTMFDRWINEDGVRDAMEVMARSHDLILAKAWGRTIRK